MEPKLLEFHAFVLTDTGTRLDQYARALAAVVRPGDVVLDLGAGMGVLSFMACRRGARHVYAVETTEALDFARHLAHAEALTDRITFLDGASEDVALPERVDVIVADIHGPFGLQGGGLSAMYDARDRWLAPHGTIVPAQVELLVAPIEAPALYARHVDVWRQVVQSVDLSPVRDAAVNQPYAAHLNADALLAPPAVVDHVDLRSGHAPRVGGHVACTIARNGTLHGLCGAGRSTLAPGITTCNAPGMSSTTNYACLFFPIQSPIAVERGDLLELEVTTFDNIELRWAVTVRDADGTVRHRLQHATLQATPGFPAWLRKHRPDYRPQRSQQGTMELALLSRFDGTWTVAELDAWLAGQAPDQAAAARKRARILRATIERCG